MIPKVIHYCWFGKNPMPILARKCIKSWKKYAPEYKIVEWNESNYDVNAHPFTRAAYQAGAWAFVSDYVRLQVVYENGGLYFDTDVELLKNIDFLLNNECFLGIQQSDNRCATGLGFGAEKNNPIIKKMLLEYEKVDFSILNKMKIMCPILNDRVLKQMGYTYNDQPVIVGGALVLPSRFLDPYSPGRSFDLLCDDTISIHHYAASWMPIFIRWRRKIINLIGLKHIQSIKKYLL